MIENLLFFAFGLFLLYVGAELLVGASSRMALLLNIAPVIVGLTVVAFGTSAPEFIVSFIAAVNGKIRVATGNIVGSNIANIGLVLAFSALLRPIVNINRNILKELIWLIAASLFMYFFALDGELVRWEGALLTAGIIGFTLILIKQSVNDRNNAPVEDVPDVDTGWARLDNLPRGYKLFFLFIGTLIGIIILGYGSNMTIEAAVAIAEYLGVGQMVIGLTMVAFGTSLPELATGIISVIKKENDILVGNIIGSNIFNILGVAGPIALLFHIPVLDSNIRMDFPIMLAFTFLLFWVLWFRKKLGRLISLLMICGYLLYIFYTFINIS